MFVILVIMLVQILPSSEHIQFSLVKPLRKLLPRMVVMQGGIGIVKLWVQGYMQSDKYALMVKCSNYFGTKICSLG